MSTTASKPAADRRGRRAHRHDPADDPLLRGDRPAAGRRRPRAGQAPHLHARPTSSGSARSSGCATCWACRSTSCRSCWRPRPPAPTCGASTSTPTIRPSTSGSSSGRSGTSAPSSSWSAGGARSSTSSRTSSRTSGAGQQATGGARRVSARVGDAGVRRRTGADCRMAGRRPPRDGRAVGRPSVHRHRAGLDPGAAAIPDRARPPQLSRPRRRSCSRRRSRAR